MSAGTVLYLCAANDGLPLMGFLDAHPVYTTADKVEERQLRAAKWIVSYGYRHILPREVCERFDGRAVNLHIGYLPWNRGAHPNVWSALEGTPSGVTLHHMDAGVDTGDVIAQERVLLADDLTLRASYGVLRAAAEGMFGRVWPEFVAGRASRTKQVGAGTYHRIADLPPDVDWDTPRGMICGNVFA